MPQVDAVEDVVEDEANVVEGRGGEGVVGGNHLLVSHHHGVLLCVSGASL